MDKIRGTLEQKLDACNTEADELYDEGKMWQAKAAAAEETARAAVAVKRSVLSIKTVLRWRRACTVL